MLIGEILKERGQQLALLHSGSWKDEMLKKLKEYIAELKSLRKYYNVHDEITFGQDEFRRWCLERDFSDPESINAWGSFGNIGKAAGLIEATDRTVKSTIPSARARRIVLWRAL